MVGRITSRDAEADPDHIPDPSTLTMDLLNRTAQALRIEFGDKITALKDVLSARLDGNDKATIVLAENLNRVPTTLDRETLRLTEIFAERLKGASLMMAQQIESINLRFRERDTRTELEKVAASTAVTAAFSAQKEAAANQDRSNAQAISKSEAWTAKQMEDLKLLFNSKNASTDDKIADIADRITRVESGARGGLDARSQSRDERSEKRLDNGTVISVAAVLVSVVIAAVSLSVTFFRSH